MRVNIHDYSGHPFQVELSRELARRGHDVVHHFSDQYVTGHGDLTDTSGSAGRLRIEPIHADTPFNKYDFVGRARFELAYARAWSRVFRRETFDVVVMCNVPLLALSFMQRPLRSRRAPWLLWHQDIYSQAVGDELRRRLPPAAAGPLARAAARAEIRQLRRAAGVVAIADAFVRRYRSWRIDTAKVTVIPNWAPLPPAGLARDNDWAREHGLPVDAVRLLYAGTLGRKHNPQVLVELMDRLGELGVKATLTVCSEGSGADDLRGWTAGRPDVTILPFQDAAVFAQVLASADVMVAILEAGASEFSVPSKVLSYVAAGRSTIALMPADNPAAETVRRAGGVVADPDGDGVRAAADWLVGDFLQSDVASRNARARAFAEAEFDIGPIADRFEAVLDRAVRSSG